jgi:hypothetical protein
MFVVRLDKTHDKLCVFAVRFSVAHGKGWRRHRCELETVSEQGLSCVSRRTHGKHKYLPCVGQKHTANKAITVRKCVSCGLGKTHDKECLCRAPDKKRTAKFFTHGKARFSRSE